MSYEKTTSAAHFSGGLKYDLEQTTGGRLIQAYNTIGGVQADIHPEFVKKVKELIKYLRPVLKEYHEIFTGNVIAQQRLKGTGVLTREDAVSFGATGGTGRASGWKKGGYGAASWRAYCRRWSF